MKEWIVDGYHLRVSLVHLQPSLTSASVVFDFNASLNDAAPVPPITFAVYEERNEKSELLIDAMNLSSFFCLHYRD